MQRAWNQTPGGHRPWPAEGMVKSSPAALSCPEFAHLMKARVHGCDRQADGERWEIGLKTAAASSFESKYFACSRLGDESTAKGTLLQKHEDMVGRSWQLSQILTHPGPSWLEDRPSRQQEDTMFSQSITSSMAMQAPKQVQSPTMQ